MSNLVLLDLFSGMGGFHLGLENAGFNFRKVYFSEIDKHAIANYKYNFNNAEYIGSVESILTSGIERPNIITFGSPCQDFSLAGKRKGLDGDRSSLIEYALSAVSHFRPDVFIWENVKGTFSSNGGRDFIAILQAIADIGLYECEWQLVNTSWLLPQNRERIYLVGHLATSFRDWRGVFPIEENDFKLSEKEQSSEGSYRCKDIAGCLTGGGHSGGLHSDMDIVIHQRGHGFVNDSITDTCPTIRSSSFEHKHGEKRIYTDIAPTIQARYGTGGDNIPYVNYPTKEVKAVLTPDRINKRQNGRRMKNEGEPSFTLTSQDIHGVSEGENVRRLTEIECERLQGFPDNWTGWGVYDGVTRKISKTQRYKMCGNAVTAKMVKLIGSRIYKNLNNYEPTNHI